MFGLMPWRKDKMAGPLLPEAPFQLMRRELDSLFGRFFGLLPREWAELDQPVGWGMTVEEKDKEVVLKAEAPGFEVGDFDVRLVGDELIIEALRKEEKKDGEELERRLHLRRAIAMPAGIDPDKVEAFYRKGMLEVHLPRTAEAMGRKVEVKV